EHLGGILRLHALIHGDDALEARGVGLGLLAGRGGDLGLAGLGVFDLGLDALLGRFQQALADLDLACPRVEFLAARLQPLQDRALGRRDLGVLLRKDDDAIGLRRLAGGQLGVFLFLFLLFRFGLSVDRTGGVSG